MLADVQNSVFELSGLRKEAFLARFPSLSFFVFHRSDDLVCFFYYLL